MSTVLRRAAAAARAGLPAARRSWALDGGLTGRALQPPRTLPWVALAPHHHLLGARTLAESAAHSEAPAEAQVTPPAGAQVPQNPAPYSTGQENFILLTMNQIRTELLAEQRKLTEESNKVHQAIQDLRRDLITGTEFITESRKVIGQSLKVYDQIKDTRQEIKVDLIAESRKVLEEISKVSQDVRELGTNIKSTNDKFNITVSRLIISILLGILGLFIDIACRLVPYFADFVDSAMDKTEKTWEYIKSKGKPSN